MMSRQLVKQRELFEWLHSLDLSHHFEPFVQNGYEDLRICAEMGESDLEIIGVRDIHEKIELLQAIRHLRLSHFGKETFTTTTTAVSGQFEQSDGGGHPRPKYLEYQAHFQNGDEIKYCLQKRYLPPTGNSSQVEDSSAANSDYQDIDDCDCGPPFFEDQYYEPLSPQRHQRQLVFANSRTPIRKLPPQHHHQPSADDQSTDAIQGTKTPLRDHHPIRRHPDPSRPFGQHLSSELTQESIGGCLRSAHLYGSGVLQSTAHRKVESEDLDSSSGIEPDLVSRKCYDPRNPTTGNRNTGSRKTGSSSTTPEEGQEQHWWEGGPGTTAKEKTTLKNGGWYRGPPTCSSLAKKDGGAKKSNRNGLNCGLDVLQLQPNLNLTTGLHDHIRPTTKRHSSGSSPKSSTLSRRQRDSVAVEPLANGHAGRGVVVVPTVSGLLSSIEANQFYGQQQRSTPKKHIAGSMASNINCREFDYEECQLNNTYEEIGSRGGPNNYRTPTHLPYPHHQYLEHVIVSSACESDRLSGLNPPPGYDNELNCNGVPPNLPTPTRNRQIYTPGIYSPSSCLMDRDDIYDYAPPIQRNRHYQSSPAKMYSPFRSKGKSKSKTSLSCVVGCEDSENGTVRGNRGGGAPLTPLHRSASLLTSHSTPTYVNVLEGSSRKGATGGNGPKVLSFPSSPSSQSSNGCRTLANLSKLSRRLGLARLFRTLRIHGNGEATRKTTVLTKPRLQQAGINQKSASFQQQPTEERHVATSNHIQHDCVTTMSSLPSNERIIQTINRLKYEELQKRKARIAQEHQMILKELKTSLSLSSSSSASATDDTTNKKPKRTKGDTASTLAVNTTRTSVFYVSATVEPSSSTPSEAENLVPDAENIDADDVLRTGQSSAAFSARPSAPNSSKPREKFAEGEVMGQHQSSFQAEETGGEDHRLGKSPGESWAELRNSRESSNEKSSSSRTSSSSNYHSESTFENSHEQEAGDGATLKATPPSSPRLSSPKSHSRLSNPMKGQKKNKSQTEQAGSGRGLEEDSIEALADDYVLPLPSASNGGSGSGSGSSPNKSLLSKVKELGARNHKKLRRFSFSSKSSQSDHIHGSTEGIRRGSDVLLTPTKPPSAAIDIVGGSSMEERNSSDEDCSLSSMNQRSLSICDIEEYTGPFVGEAVALVDCISSPYDLHALSYKKGDILQIIEKKPTGSWKGKLKLSNKVGYFKFINVQLLPNPEETENVDGEYGTPVPHPSSSLDSATFPYSTSNGSGTHGRRRMKATSPLTPLQVETRQVVANVINGIRKEDAALLHQLNSRREQGDESAGPGEDPDQIKDATQQPGTYQTHSSASQKRSKSSGRRRSSSSLKKERPRSVGDLLKRINLEDYIPLFILHGFESLDLFKELEEEDLDRLSITELEDRVKIMTAVELLRDYDATEEIPPIIIPTYSCPSPCQLVQDDEDPLNQILEPPPNFTRGGTTTTGTAAVRDSGVFLKCDDKEEEDPEVEEIILSPSNLPMSNLNPSDKFLLTNLRHKSSTKQVKPTVQQLENDSNMAQFSSLEEHYGEVRQRFLHAKSLFESSGNSSGGTGVSSGATVKPHSSEYKNQFLYCEKSSDSGISLGANSPPPNNNTYE